MKNYKVSVLVTSYNHIDIVERAIDSVRNQVTNFDYEIVVVDDGSTDGSRELLASKYSGIENIKLHLWEHKGIMKNYCDGFALCGGEYIAVCDCDDYWVDSNKLELQITYMDNNPNCGMCFTNVFREDEYGKRLDDGKIPEKHDVSYDKMLKGGYIYTQSIFIRREAYLKYANLDKFLKAKLFIWDYPIYLALIKNTEVVYLPYKTAVYVQNAESFSNTRKRVKRIKYVFGVLKIKTYFVLRYGISFKTFLYVYGYKFPRDVYSIIFKRWYK